MKKSFNVGQEVYHKTFVHLGKGVVEKIYFDSYNKKKIIVIFERKPDSKYNCTVSDLRTTPNFSKMKRIISSISKNSKYKDCCIDENYLNFNKKDD